MGKLFEISLTEDSQAFVDERLASGTYETPQAVIEAGLRLLEHREQKREALRSALQDGLDSGEARELDFDELFDGNLDIVTGERRSA